MQKVLIVDDERLILNGLSKSLSNNSTEIKIVETGNDALKEIASCFYDLCFLDIYLPDINGLEVMKKLKETSPSTRIVIMSARNISDDMRKEIEDNAYHFIGKPFDLSQIKTISELTLGSAEGYRSYEAGFKERRKFIRRPFLKTIDYFAGVFEGGELKVLPLRGDIIDILSESGIGIRTDYPLSPGYMIRFPDETKYNVGIVKWSISAGSGSYRAGIEFRKDRV